MSLLSLTVRRPHVDLGKTGTPAVIRDFEQFLRTHRHSLAWTNGRRVSSSPIVFGFGRRLGGSLTPFAAYVKHIGSKSNNMGSHLDTWDPIGYTTSTRNPRRQ